MQENIENTTVEDELQDDDLFDQTDQITFEDRVESEGLKLDYTIESPVERNKLVTKIVESLPPQKLTSRYLQILADYIIFAMSKEEKKSKHINTDNRMITINKRETSFEGLVSKFESGEDGIYNMIVQNDKNIIFTPKIKITEEDVANIPALKQLRQAIKVVEEQEKTARGKRKYLLKKQLIEMRQDQYVIKNAYTKPIYCLNAVKNFNSINFDENIEVLPSGKLKDNSLLSFLNPKHISILLCNYSRLKEDCYGKLYTDGYYLMWDLDSLIEETLRDKYPLYYSLLIYKIDGKSNLEIQQLLDEQHGVKHSIEYISSLWRNKIPKLLAQQFQKDYLEWYYTNKEKGQWKKCSRCGEIKLAHNVFFSKNTSSKDGFYSICKECRNKKTKEKKKDIRPKIIKRVPYIGPNE